MIVILGKVNVLLQNSVWFSPTNPPPFPKLNILWENSPKKILCFTRSVKIFQPMSTLPTLSRCSNDDFSLEKETKLSEKGLKRQGSRYSGIIFLVFRGYSRKTLADIPKIFPKLHDRKRSEKDKHPLNPTVKAF